MKYLNLLLASVICINVSCASYSGNSHTGDYKATIFATNHKGYKQSASQLSFDEANQSQAALSAIRTVGTVAGAWISMKGILGLSDNSTKEVVTASNNQLKATTEKEVTKRAAHAASAAPSTVLP